MLIRFWGVRGSTPAPLAPEDFRKKIAAVIQRVQILDLKDSEARQRFLSKLPPEIFSTTGGNTSCIEVRSKQGAAIILDMGSGLRELEKNIKKQRENILEYHVFFSHFHYDHLVGLPFFGSLYNPKVKVFFYSPFPAMEENLRKFMDEPYHPVGWDSFAAEIHFRVLKEKEPLSLGGVNINWIHRNHPGGSVSYRIQEGKSIFIYSTDTELTGKDFEQTAENIAYFKDADVIVLDAQYTLGEAIEKYDWGHSSYSLAVEFAREFAIKKLYLFHHDPLNDDNKMEGILRSAKWYDGRLDHQESGTVDVELAREGHEFEI